MTEHLEIIQTNELHEQEKKHVFYLWNSEYPEKLSYTNLTDFDNYLQSISNVRHFLITSNTSPVLGWALTFDRKHERWFAIILSEKIKGQGFGRKMLDNLKHTEPILNGWVIDHNNDKKKNGQFYISPLKFYEKCGFEILTDVRLELDKISAVKIRWTNKQKKYIYNSGLPQAGGCATLRLGDSLQYERHLKMLRSELNNSEAKLAPTQNPESLGGDILNNTIMTIEPFGEIEFIKRKNEWYGLVNNICPDNNVELYISVANIDQDLQNKIELVKKLAEDYESIVADLYDLAYKKYKGTAHEVTRKEIEKMYFLTAVNLKEDNRTWWLTLEPVFNVTSIYNHFLRFTMLDRKIIWANFDINTTT